MFAARYFGPRPFAARYFPKTGGAIYYGAHLVGYAGRDQLAGLSTDMDAAGQRDQLIGVTDPQLRGQHTRNLG